MANTNPLDALNIKKLVGFKQIKPGDLGSVPVTALYDCGITLIDGISNNATIFSIDSMTVLGNTFYGLVGKTAKTKFVSYVNIPLLEKASLLKEKAIQAGFRLTSSAVPQNQRGTGILNVFNRSSSGRYPIVGTLTEDNSAYYEIVIGPVISSSFSIRVFVNKQQVWSDNLYINPEEQISLRAGAYSGGFTVAAEEGFTFMLGDMYIAELDYNSDRTVTPQLLGNLTLEPFTVASYAGDKHTNTKNQDIVTALNTIDPNNDMGVLAIKPVEQAANVTFNAPDIAGKSIYGVSLNIVYKDSVAPNNRLSYQITEGTTQLPTEIITTRNADIVGYTTFSKILTTPANGGDWNAENLKFKLDMFNRGTE
ncbi:hypothetical protein OD305_001370 [Salmonella enterica]|nr:hypothetical protein [Salmonella enterica]EJX3099141.1 hypothetical protein [Salmonella enterica]EJX3109217.1 hypothetical protein [Salmonella enterica]EJX3600755.1 hypothetical protein [Salmonella enterica]EKQ0890240.1 hypothetical protein [Salmonella enterica]